MILIGKLAPEEAWFYVTCSSFQPDVEEVREFRIHHVVIVRRVHHHKVDTVVRNMVEMVSRFTGDGHRRRSVRRIRTDIERH